MLNKHQSVVVMVLVSLGLAGATHGGRIHDPARPGDHLGLP